MNYRTLFSSSDSYYSLLVNQIYLSLMTGEWCSHTSELAKFNHVDAITVKEKGKKSMEGYNELKKAFTDVLKALKDRCPSSIEEEVFKKEKKVRYTGNNKDPFAEERAYCRKQTIADYVRFCKGSLGLLPQGWFSAFFEGTQQLGEAKLDARNGKIFIGASHEHILQGIELLPQLYDCIDKEVVVSFDYHPYGKNQEQVILHPQYLKEFNGRWFVLGYKEGSHRFADVFALDRIKGHLNNVNIDNIRARPGFYTDFFRNIVGVTHEPGRELEHVVIKTYSLYVHGLMKTKPVHSSFAEICPYSSQDGYGLISYDVEPNREFIGRILSFGANLEVLEPFALRKEIAINAECLAQVYSITSTTKMNDSESE